MGLRNTGDHAIITIKIHFKRKFLNYFQMIKAV